MKLASANSRRVSVPLTRPYAIASGSWDAVEMVFVELVAVDGTRGFGQASPEEGVTGETIDACAAALRDENLAWLVGRDADALALQAELSRRVRGPAARAAIDIAVHDLAAKRAGKALVECLGRVHHELATSITIGVKPVDETLAEADEYAARGFRALKVKTGVSVDEDIERLVKLRARFGARFALRVDANQGYDAAALARFVLHLDALALEMIEQPLPRGAEDELRALPPRVRRLLAADESVHDAHDLDTLVSAGCPFGIVNVKLMKCGGITPALRLAESAQRAGLELMWGCMDESVVGISAALHAAFSARATRYLDLDGSFDLARDPFRGGFTLRDGCLSTLARPGLGVEHA